MTRYEIHSCEQMIELIGDYSLDELFQWIADIVNK